jgi:hypothetical protein
MAGVNTSHRKKKIGKLFNHYVTLEALPLETVAIFLLNV